MKKLVWLGIALAVLLAVGVGGAIAVVADRPWEDDTSADEGDPTGEGASGSAQPTGPGSEAPEGRGDPPYVTGDLDGDGLGDVVGVYHDDVDDPVFRFTLHSTGTGFQVAEDRLRTTFYEDRALADFDADGTLDAVTYWVGEGNDVVEIVPEVEGYEELRFRPRLNPREPFVDLIAGHFDDDELPDLAMLTNPDPDTITVSVLRNSGDGFEQPAVWFSRDDSTFSSTELRPGDFDGDGLTDLFARLPTQKVQQDEQYYEGRQAVGLLTSTGSAFELSALGHEGDGISLGSTPVLAGDFTGAGEPMVAFLIDELDGSSVEVYSWDGSAWARERTWSGRIDDSAGDWYVDNAAVSDVDGDGSDDLVYVSKSVGKMRFNGYQVALATDAGFELAKPWAPTPPCDVSYCLLFFQDGS